MIHHREVIKMENYETLIEELRKYSDETPWLEFKHNNYSPEMIGKDISALATTHEIVGTDYNLQTLRKGKQELENWLRSLLSDNAEFEFHTIKMNNLDVIYQGHGELMKKGEEKITYPLLDGMDMD